MTRLEVLQLLADLLAGTNRGIMGEDSEGYVVTDVVVVDHEALTARLKAELARLAPTPE
jgi:hypothetical protein